MKDQTARKAGALVGAVVLAGAGVAGAVPAMADEAAPVASAEQAAEAGMAGGHVAVADVQGSFEFDQSSLSMRDAVVNVFSKASAALCGGIPAYEVRALARAVAVAGDVDSSFEATLAEMAAKADARQLVMACACASNLPGGGAIVNAEVSGVTLESIANLAGA